jgi:hypothetical protein
MTAFISWAKNQLETADKKIVFSTKALIDSARREGMDMRYSTVSVCPELPENT